jgi:tetrahydromethanopterin S-methyltransferase subunit G
MNVATPITQKMLIDTLDQAFLKFGAELRNSLRQDIKEASNDILGVLKDFIAHVDERFNDVGVRLDKIETKLDAVENRLDTLETKLDGVTAKLDHQAKKNSTRFNLLEVDVTLLKRVSAQ